MPPFLNIGRRSERREVRANFELLAFVAIARRTGERSLEKQFLESQGMVFVR